MSLAGMAAPVYSRGALVAEGGGAEVRLGVVLVVGKGSSLLGSGGGDEDGVKDGEVVEGTGVSLLREGVSLLGSGV